MEQLISRSWDCKSHIVVVPKYRKKALYGEAPRQVREILLSLGRQLDVEILEAHLMRDHVHRCLKVAPKYGIFHVVGFLKGKSAVWVHRALGYKRMTWMRFWSRGYCLSTVGPDEETMQRCARQGKGEFRWP